MKSISSKLWELSDTKTKRKIWHQKQKKCFLFPLVLFANRYVSDIRDFWSPKWAEMYLQYSKPQKYQFVMCLSRNHHNKQTWLLKVSNRPCCELTHTTPSQKKNLKHTTIHFGVAYLMPYYTSSPVSQSFVNEQICFPLSVRIIVSK